MIEPAQYVLHDDICKSNTLFVLNEFVKDLKNISGKCMDIGCGPGDITKNMLLPILDPSTDIMEEIVKYANKTYGDEKRLKFEVLDIQTENLPEKYISNFDCIFSFHTLQWCNNICQTFNNIYCMLRPGKTMLILSIAHHLLFECLKTMAQDIRYASYMGDKKKYIGSFHYSIRPHEELNEILENIGFQVHHCSHRNMNSFLSTDNYISLITSQYTFKFLNKMPHNLRQEFKNELIHIFEKMRVEEYKKQNNYKLCDDEMSNIPFSYTILIVYAQKKIS